MKKANTILLWNIQHIQRQLNLSSKFAMDIQCILE